MTAQTVDQTTTSQPDTLPDDDLVHITCCRDDTVGLCGIDIDEWVDTLPADRTCPACRDQQKALHATQREEDMWGRCPGCTVDKLHRLLEGGSA